MRSHTVPRKLLDQFAYEDPITGSRRLWGYSKGHFPNGRISPKRATRIGGHFADPNDLEREAKLEERLNREFEDPVHKFIEQLNYRTFVLSRSHIRKLTRYISLLFNRSQARRNASKQYLKIILESAASLLGNEEQLQQIAGRWTLEMVRDGYSLDRIATVEDVKDELKKLMQKIESNEHEQTSYVDTMERAMAFLDEAMDNGIWNVIHTSSDNSFVIGDAPVVTWERNENNFLIHGQGFFRPNVEVFLPVSPTTCLHILPAVQRTREIMQATIREINEAQAAFSTQYCFAHINSAELNAVLQPKFNSRQIGINAFSIRHRNYTNTLFDLLMSGGRNFNAPPL